jgi:uncharacterized membrane protein YphA (DoxX/SURF4 family)
MQLNKTISFLDRAVAIEPLVTFRILFGALMAFSTIRFMVLGWIDDHYIQPLVHFKYYGFGWVEVVPPLGIYAVHILMILAALGVMVGLYYRASAIVLFLTFTYTELIDVTYYLNHYYFVSIACVLMVILPAHKNFSLDVAMNRVSSFTTTPQWTILLLKFQLGVVYLYAGIAKINYDWLVKALPLKIWMPANDQLPVVGWMLALPMMPYVFSWIGMLYDCTIVFWLSNKKTRLLAYASVVFFHAITGLMFQIGVFPLVMMAATLIFFSAEWHKKVLSALKLLIQKIVWVRGKENVQVGDLLMLGKNKFMRYCLFLFIVFQILFPWRYLLYPGNLFWTEEGYRFSWRVMLMEKAGTATFYVKDQRTNKEGVVINSEFLNPHQEKQMAMQPDLILQFAHFLKEYYAKQGLKDPEVRAEVYVTLNARPSQLLINPTVNLASLQDGWGKKHWINPYQE